MFRRGLCRSLLLIALIAAALAIVACSKSRQEKEITLQIYSRLWTPLREQAFIRETILAGFSETSGLQVELSLYTDNDLTAIAQAGNLDGVDLVIPYGKDLPLWIEAVDLMDLEPLRDEWDDRTFILGLDPWQSRAFRNYFLPVGADAYLTVVSKDALPYRSSDIDEPLSWNEFSRWVLEASAAEGRGLLAATGVPLKSLAYLLSGTILSYGGDFPDLGSPEAAEALDLYHGMREAFHPDIGNFDSVIEPLLAGEAWFAFAHCAHAGAILKEAPDDFLVLTAPLGPAGRGSVGGISGLGVPLKTDAPEHALKLAEYLTRPSVQVAVSRGIGGFIPTVNEARQFLGETAVDRSISSGMELLLSGRIQGIPGDFPEWGNVKQVYEELFFEHILSEAGVSPELLASYQAKIESLRRTEAPEG